MTKFIFFFLTLILTTEFLKADIITYDIVKKNFGGDKLCHPEDYDTPPKECNSWQDTGEFLKLEYLKGEKGVNAIYQLSRCTRKSIISHSNDLLCLDNGNACNMRGALYYYNENSVYNNIYHNRIPTFFDCQALNIMPDVYDEFEKIKLVRDLGKIEKKENDLSDVKYPIPLDLYLSLLKEVKSSLKGNAPFLSYITTNNTSLQILENWKNKLDRNRYKKNMLYTAVIDLDYEEFYYNGGERIKKNVEAFYDLGATEHHIQSSKAQLLYPFLAQLQETFAVINEHFKIKLQ